MFSIHTSTLSDLLSVRTVNRPKTTVTLVHVVRNLVVTWATFKRFRKSYVLVAEIVFLCFAF